MALTLNTTQKIGALGGILTAVGSLLPWVTVSALGILSVSKLGVEGDGIFTLILGIIVLLGIFVFKKPAFEKFGLIILGIIITILSAYYITTISGEVAKLLGVAGAGGLISAGPSIGLYVTLIGGVLTLISGILAFKPLKS